MSNHSISSKAMRSFLFHGLKALHKPEHSIPYADELLVVKLYINSDSSLTQHTTNSAVRQAVLKYVAKLAEINPEASEFVELHYIKGLINKEIALLKDFTLEQVKHRIRRGIDQMAQIAVADENHLRQEEMYHLQRQLPLKDFRVLVGRKEQSKALSQHLVSARNRHWFLHISGIGGIGKTALVSDVISQVAETRHYSKLIWLHGKEFHPSLNPNVQSYGIDVALIDKILSHFDPPESMPHGNVNKRAYLHQTLQNQPTLLVIDGFEAIVSAETILKELHLLANPLKIVVISRNLIASQPNMTHIVLAELSKSAAYELIHDCMQISTSYSTELDLQMADSIYKAVGGNPKAIKLVIELSLHVGLPIILDDLLAASHPDIRLMYDNIFKKSWASLDTESQQLLIELACSPSDETLFEHVQAKSTLDMGLLSAKLVELAQASLIEVRGTHMERAYSCAQITTNFCQIKQGNI